MYCISTLPEHDYDHTNNDFVGKLRYDLTANCFVTVLVHFRFENTNLP